MRQARFPRAEFLSELRSSLPATPEVAFDSIGRDRSDELVRKWQKASQLDDDMRFAARLAAEGFDREAFGRLLTLHEKLAASRTTTAEWHDTLRAVLAWMASPRGATADAVEDGKPSFAAALEGFVAVGWERLRARAPSDDGLAFEIDWGGLVAPLQRQLSHTLLQQCCPTLVLELNVARVEGRLSGETPEARFCDYVETLLKRPTEWERLFDEYQGLARLLCVALERWTDEVCEMLEHLASDFRRIVATMWGKNERLRLTQITGAESDSHRGGRVVWKLTFVAIDDDKTPLSVIYKSRSLAVDTHFQALLAFCNEGASDEGGFPSLEPLRVVDGADHGWVEYVERADCNDMAAAARFYARQGAYLALLHLLDGVDLHYENLIARGEHPMLIDLETLFHGNIPDPPDQPDDARKRVRDRLRQSVMRTLLLPGRMMGNREHAGVNFSGLGNGETQWSPYATATWTDAGTDAMHRIDRHFEIPPGINLPRVDGVVVPVAQHTEAVVRGFESMLRFLTSRREALLADGSPLAAFARDQVRRVMRRTSAYARLLHTARHPDHLRDLLARERVLDHLWSMSWDQPCLLRVILSEKEDMRLGDIPYFISRPNSRDLWDSRDEMLADVLPATGMETVLARLRTLDGDAIATQTFIIRSALSASSFGAVTSVRSSRAAVATPTTCGPTGLDAAIAIGERLLDTAILGPHDASWIGMASSGGLGESTYQVAPLGEDLYGGTGGVALFLAYLGRISGEERFTHLAERAALATRATLDERAASSSGGFLGVTSQLYVLSHLAVLWGDPALLPSLGSILAKVKDSLPKDDAFDVLSGAAGRILTLVAVHEATGDEQALEVAVACGRHLAQHAVRDEVGASWRTPVTSRALLGFSHGAGGIAYALLRLAQALTSRGEFSDDAFRFAMLAEDAMTFERAHFDTAHNNWPDFRHPPTKSHLLGTSREEQRFMLAWCHGAPGVALSRLTEAPTVEARREVEIAVASTLAGSMCGNQILCHGELGNLMIINRAAAVLCRSDWRAQVEQRLSTVLARLGTTGPSCGFDFPQAVPALMFGISGIGYAFLQLERPDEVPLVLALAPPSNRASL